MDEIYRLANEEVDYPSDEEVIRETLAEYVKNRMENDTPISQEPLMIDPKKAKIANYIVKTLNDMFSFHDMTEYKIEFHPSPSGRDFNEKRFVDLRINVTYDDLLFEPYIRERFIALLNTTYLESVGAAYEEGMVALRMVIPNFFIDIPKE